MHFDESNIKSGLDHKTIKRFAWICHDKDTYTENEEAQGKGKAGELKPKHWHIVIHCPSGVALSAVAKWFGVPENFVDMPKGRGAFLDCVQYLTHESEKCQAEGKTLYADEEVNSNFDWRQELEERAANILKYGRDLTPKDRMRFDVLYDGKTLKECREDDKFLYMDNLTELKKFRLEYITNNQEVPNTRINIYITGKGGVGKDTASRAIARALYPDLESDEDIFLKLVLIMLHLKVMTDNLF